MTIEERARSYVEWMFEGQPELGPVEESEEYLRLVEALRSTAEQARAEALEEAAKVADAYAERNRHGEDQQCYDLGWVSTYHRIAGENVAGEIRSRLVK